MAKPSVRVPAPSLVRPPTPPIAAVLIVVLPAPPTVVRKPPLVMPPVRVSVPASLLMREALAWVIAPPQVLVPLMFLKAPAEPTPSEFSVSASAPTVMLPCSSSAAPAATVTPPAVVPVPCAFCTFSTPALTLVAPV